MKNGFYETRKKQMQAFARSFKKGEVSLSELLEDACTSGAAEERYRCLKIVRDSVNLVVVERKIVAVSVEEVLGYSKRKKS